MELVLLVKQIRAHLNDYKKLLITPHSSQGKSYAHNWEAQLSFDMLESAIKQLEAENQEQEVTPQHVKIITDFFENRWNNLIINTPVIYTSDAKSPINACCILIAKYLAEQTKLVAPKNYLNLLMPTLISCYSESSRYDLSTKYLHTFIPSGNNQFLIEIAHVYDHANLRNNLVLGVALNGKEVELTASEVERVRKHSQATVRYYDAFLSKKSDRAERLKEANELLLTVLRDENYGGLKVEYSYGEEGEALLLARLLNHVNKLFKTREQLVDYIAGKLDRSEWLGFIDKIDKKVLIQLFTIAGKNIFESITEIIHTPSTFTQINIYNRAVLFCLIEAYWCDRKDKGEHTSISGRFFGWPKSVKEPAKNALLGYLIDDGKSGADLLLALDTLTTSLAGAMKEGTLGAIYLKMCEVLKASDEVKQLKGNVKLKASAK